MYIKKSVHGRKQTFPMTKARILQQLVTYLFKQCLSGLWQLRKSIIYKRTCQHYFDLVDGGNNGGVGGISDGINGGGIRGSGSDFAIFAGTLEFLFKTNFLNSNGDNGTRSQGNS